MGLRERTWFTLLILAAVVALAVVFVPGGVSALAEQRLKKMSVAELEQVLSGDPNNLKARYRLGLVYSADNRHLDATRAFLQVLAADPARSDVLNDLGVAYLLQERYYESLVALQSAQTLDPQNARVLANLGRLHLATKMPFTAARELGEAAKRVPSDAGVWSDLAEAQQRTLNMNGAEASYRRALQLNPRDPTALVGLGSALFGLTRYDEAEKILREALQSSPDLPPALQTLGRMRLQRATNTEELKAARALLRDAAEKDPYESETEYDLGKCALQLGDPRSALNHLRRALALNPGHEGALYQLGRALRANGAAADAAKAEQRFRALSLRNRDELRLEERVSRAPEDNQARSQLLAIYLANGNAPLANLMCRELLQRDPNNPQLPAFQKEIARQLALREQPRRNRQGTTSPPAPPPAPSPN